MDTGAEMEQRTDSEAVKLSAKADTRNKKKKRYPFDFVVVQVQIWPSARMLLVRHLYVRMCTPTLQSAAHYQPHQLQV